MIQRPPLSRGEPAIAASSDGFLVVWSDERNQFPYEIRGIRLDRSGDPIDDVDFFVGSGSGYTGVSVASDGRDYMVTYRCGFDGVNAISCVTRVSGSGRAELVTRMKPGASSVIAWNGTHYLVVWRPVDYEVATAPLTGQLLTAEGQPYLEPFPIAASNSRAAIASNGREVLLVFKRSLDLHTAMITERRVRELGTVSTFRPRLPETTRWAVASNGVDFLVAWEEGVEIVPGCCLRYRTRTATVSAEGLFPRGDPLLPSTTPARIQTLSWNGTDYVLSFYEGNHEHGRIAALSLSASGEPRETSARTVEITPYRVPVLQSASTGTSVVLAWEQPQFRHAMINVKRIDDLSNDPPITVPRSISWQASPSAVQIGEQTVVAWSDLGGDGVRPRVLVARIRAGRDSIDGPGVSVESTPLHQVNPALGGNLIAWLEQPESSGDAVVRAKRLGDHGLPIDESSVVIGLARRDTTVGIARIGSNHLVAWTNEFGQLVVSRVAGSGQLLDTVPIRLSTGETSGEINPAVATDGRDYFVVWNREMPSGVCLMTCARPASVEGMLVTREAVPVGKPVAIGPLDSTAPAVVWNGRTYTIVWNTREYFDWPTLYTLNARRFDGSGNSMDTGRVVIANGFADQISIQADERGFLFFTSRIDFQGYRPVVGRITADLSILEWIALDGALATERSTFVQTTNGPALVHTQLDPQASIRRVVVRMITEARSHRRRGVAP